MRSSSVEQEDRMRRREVARNWVTIAMVALLGTLALAQEPPASDATGEKRALADIKATEGAATVKTATKLYKDGEYPLAGQRFDEALASNPDDEQALLFSGLTELRLDNPEKAYVQWGKFQAQTKNRKVGDEVAKARTILLREVSERAAKEAVASEMALRTRSTSPRLVAVATFKNGESDGRPATRPSGSPSLPRSPLPRAQRTCTVVFLGILDGAH